MDHDHDIIVPLYDLRGTAAIRIPGNSHPPVALRRQRALILNWFRAEGAISAGIVEGLNNKAELTMRKAYGFRTAKAIEIALYHQLGNLPEPEFTHEFW